MYRALIIEDTPAEAEALRAHLARWSAERDVPLNVEVLPSALEFVNSRLAADLILMDIDLPGVNGMEAAQILRTYDAQTPLIFVTNLAQYAVRGYAVDALDFVVKPVEYHDFALRMNRALRVMERLHASTVALPTDDGVRVVAQSDIAYVDMLKHDVCYHLASGEELRERGSLRAAEQTLDQSLFLRINSGCLVNMGQVRHIGPASVTMSEGTELYFSRSQKKYALETLANYVGRSI